MALLTPALLFSISAWASWRAAWRGAAAEVSRTADAASEYARRLLEAQALRTGRADDLLAGMSDDAVREKEPELHAALRRISGEPALEPVASYIFVYNSDRFPLVSSTLMPVPQGRRALDVEFSSAFRQSGAPTYHVTPLHLGRDTGRSFFSVVARRGRSGEYEGAISASVYADSVTPALQILAAEPGDVVALVRTDGALLARSSGFEGRTATPPRLQPHSPMLPVMARGDERAMVRAVSTVDGVERVAAYRRVGGEWPVYASAARDRDTVIAAWRRDVLPQALLAGASTLLLLMLAAAVLRQQRGLEASHDTLERRVAARTAELADRDVRLTLAMSAASLGILEWDLEAGTLYADSRVEEITRGLLPSGRAFEIDGPERAAWRSRIHPDDLPRREALRAAMLGGGADAPADEYRVRLPGGADWSWIATRSIVLTRNAESGRPVRVLDVLLDVTARRAAEEALRDSEGRLRLALATGGLGVVEWDLDEGVIRVDEGVEAISRGLLPSGRPLTLDGAERQAWVARIDPQDQKHREAQMAALEAGLIEVIRGDYRVRVPHARSDALEEPEERIWITYRGGAVERDPASGRLLRMIDVIQDITERKRIEEALAASEARLRLATEGARVGIWELDITSGVSRLSAEAASLLSVSQEVVGAGKWLRLVHQGDRAHLTEAWRRCERGETTCEIEFRTAVPEADGCYRWLLARGSVERGADGATVRARGILLDVTARRQAEEHRYLLTREVDHRAKNALAVVRSAIRLTPGAANAPTYRDALEARVDALARAQSLLAESSWCGTSLRQLLESTFAPFLSSHPSGVMLDGEEVVLAASAVQPLGMALHELATNATKYGALSLRGGEVHVSWQVDNGTLRFIWNEVGGPVLNATPERRGFGTRVVERTVEGQLGGRTTWDWCHSGLSFEMSFPASRVLDLISGRRMASRISSEGA